MSETYRREDISKDTVEFKITLDKEEFKKEYNKILKKELEDTSLKGFRKGQVPEEFIESHVSHTLKIQAFENLLPKLVEDALIKENVFPIAPPQYKELPNFKKDQDLEFTINITVMPKFKLGNLKKIKLEVQEEKIESKEVEDAIERLKKNQKTKEKEVNEKWAKEIIKLLKLENVKDLKGLKKHIKDAMLTQKKLVNRHKLEDSALKKGVEISNIEIPKPAVEYEASEREKAFVTDMQQKGINVDDFTKANNITLEKMREMWLKDAQQALETDVFLRMYADERAVQVTDKDLDKKIEQIKKGVPEGGNPELFKDKRWREYIRGIEQKEMACQRFFEEVLEGKKEKTEEKK